MNQAKHFKMQTKSLKPTVLPGLWREVGGLDGLVRLDLPAVTVGIVVVAKQNEPWQEQPELRWQVWPGDLEPES